MTTNLEHLIHAPKEGWSTAAIEFTSKCNLRCTFCTLSHPDYVGRDAAPETIETIKRLLAEGNVRSVSISGHGETTIFPGWEHHARELLQAGQALTTITNLAKILTDEEARTFSYFSALRVSIDSPDREQLKQIRRKVDLRIHPPQHPPGPHPRARGLSTRSEISLHLRSLRRERPLPLAARRPGEVLQRNTAPPESDTNQGPQAA
jgi:hypothetical protein